MASITVNQIKWGDIVFVYQLQQLKEVLYDGLEKMPSKDGKKCLELTCRGREVVVIRICFYNNIGQYSLPEKHKIFCSERQLFLWSKQNLLAWQFNLFKAFKTQDQK